MIEIRLLVSGNGPTHQSIVFLPWRFRAILSITTHSTKTKQPHTTRNSKYHRICASQTRIFVTKSMTFCIQNLNFTVILEFHSNSEIINLLGLSLILEFHSNSEIINLLGLSHFLSPLHSFWTYGYNTLKWQKCKQHRPVTKQSGLLQQDLIVTQKMYTCCSKDLNELSHQIVHNIIIQLMSELWVDTSSTNWLSG